MVPSDFILLAIAIFTGFIGDATLQIWAKMGLGGPNGWGLNKYFNQHGPAESLFVAGGMMGLFYATFMLTGLPVTYVNLSIYGIIIDLLFRKFMIFKSLDGYYMYYSYFKTALFIAIPMCIPLFVARSLNAAKVL
jgi:hypothetical protein